MSPAVNPESLLSLWFGDDTTEAGLFALASRWWRADPDFDDVLRSRFEPAVHAAALGQTDSWRDEPAQHRRGAGLPPAWGPGSEACPG